MGVERRRGFPACCSPSNVLPLAKEVGNAIAFVGYYKNRPFVPSVVNESEILQFRYRAFPSSLGPWMLILNHISIIRLNR